MVSASQEINLAWGVKGELKKLQQILTDIQAVLNDAEKKQVESNLVKNWLKKLKDVAYDAEDIFEEFEYEALRCKLEIHGRMRKKVRNFFSLSNPIAFRIKMAFKINDVNQTLDEIAKNMEKFKFVVQSSIIGNGFKSICCEDRETSSHLDESKVVGRKIDKSKIIDLLINSPNNQNIYSIVRIVGVGGLGKTTLAQLVYNDPTVTGHFDIKMWVCVSRNSNKKEIYSNLLESINKKKTDVSSLDVMVNSFKESLGSKKRYLIVLDDVWDDGSINLEDLLTNLLSMGVQGSKIIVTMRSDKDIHYMMGSIYTYRLGKLPEKECWYLFEKVVFGHGGPRKTLGLIKIGKEIVKKCGGVPLAAKILGGMMCSKTDESEWLSIQESEIWRLPEAEKIMGVLKLSYDHLPPHLKRCFLYCSIFPKDHFINKEKLIQLWMAEGFLICPPGESKLLEKIGNEYFNSLLQNSFFHDEKRNKWGDTKSYKMHDLVYDMALSVVGTECAISDGCMIEEKAGIEQLRHVGIVPDHDILKIPQAMDKAKKLRTIVSFTEIGGEKFTESTVWDRIFMSLRYLRVLDLRGIKNIQELPSSVGKLKQLRYLDLSNSSLRSLPDSFTRLYNLQTLRLKYCDNLKALPEGMSKLINLRHLKISRDGLIQMPREVGKLSCLRSLPIFIVGKGKGFGIEELKNLIHLRGKLNVYNLENVKNGRDASGADLKEKQHIRFLELDWTYTTNNPHVICDHQSVLEALQPHQNLKSLGIHNYGALKFPTWIMSAYNCLPNLVSLTLTNCYRCEYLPALGQLPLLQALHMEGLKSVRRIGSEFYCSNIEAAPSISFPSLIKLSLDKMQNLEEWSKHLSSSSGFPCLEELDVRGCLKLKTIPTLSTSLKKLKCFNLDIMSLVSPVISLVTSNLGSLTIIELWNCSELTFLPRAFLWGNNIIKSLTIGHCRKFEGFVPDGPEEELQHQVLSTSSLESLLLFGCSVTDLRGLNSLRSLYIWDSGRLKSLSDGVQCLPALEELSIGGFSEYLESFPFPTIGKPEGSNQYFQSLRELQIFGWSRLKSLPDQLQYLTSLQHLIISFFHSLESLPEWFGKLASLQTLKIYECENLKYLPPQDQMPCFTSLEELIIGACPLIRDICSGNELHKTSHIPKVYDASEGFPKLVLVYGSVVG